jgi:two-component system, NtrC family, response regulator HydG
MTTAPIAASLVVGRSPRMRAVFEFLRVIGPSDSTVLVIGESGTGKEVTAAREVP